MNKLLIALLKGKNCDKVNLLNKNFSFKELLAICNSDELQNIYNLAKGYGFNRFDEILQIIKTKNIKCITVVDTKYPEALKEIFDPPFMLYIRGNVDALNLDLVSIVGTRKPSLRGLHESFKIGMDLGRENIGVVSGLAAGVDSASQEGNILTNGKTVAVLGSGIDSIYPKSSMNLARDIILKNGAIISEFLPGESPKSYNFPKRNRIIAGLTRDLIIVQAPKKSGSLITGDFALQRGSDIYVHSVGVGDKRFLGSDKYYKDGAIKIDSAYPILKKFNKNTNIEIFDSERYQNDLLLKMEMNNQIVKYKGVYFKL